MNFSPYARSIRRWRPEPSPQITSADDDEAYQEGAARFRRQQDLVNARDWIRGEDDADQVEQLETQLADYSPLFWVIVRSWLIILLIIVAFALLQHSHRGDPMSEPEKPAAPAPTPPQGEPPPVSTLPAAINRFANGVLAVGTHPDTGMFFFDAQELTINEKLETLKVQALIDSLCAAGLLDRTRYENRLEVLLDQASKRLEEGAKRLAFTARAHPGGGVNGGKPS